MLALASLDLACRDHCPDVYATLTTIYREDLPPTRVPQAEVTRAFERAIRFVNASIEGLAAQLEPSNSDASDLARLIEAQGPTLGSVKIILLTNGMVDKTTGSTDWRDRKVEFDTYDIARLQRILGEGETRADITVDLQALTGAPVPCLHVPSQAGEYDAYLSVLPGEALSRIYDRYGVRLLELNVRAFLGLQGRKSVNAELRRTIADQPSMFLAYNNGIVATVDDLEIVNDRAGRPSIKSLKGLQIVNGGQTTASLHRARRKDSLNLGNVAVPIKIIKVGGADLSEMVASISRAANRQNTVQLADFSAGDPFHQLIETVANNTWLDDGKGRWFYERARGSYLAAEAKAAYRKSDQQTFRAQTPKQRRLSKLDVARYLTAWDGLPYRVCLGGQKNFQHFMQRMKDAAPPPPDAAWFKRLVAKAIFYRAAEKKIRAMKFPAYGAQITAYVVSGLAQKTGGRIDFEGLWSRQSVSAELEKLVEAWAPQIDTLLRQSAGQKNPSEWFKKEECWLDIVNRLPALSDPLPPELSYAGVADGDEVATAQPRAHSVADYERIEQCMSINAATWLALRALSRPYEIDRFLVAISREDVGKPRRVDDIVAESQVDAISNVIANQIAGFGGDAIQSAAVIWAVLSARGTLASDVMPRLLRRLRAVDATLRPDVDGLTDFLVAGRNLRRDGGSLAFYHPRVEEGLRIAMMRRKPDAEYVLSKTADALAGWDSSGSDWGVETVLGMLRNVAKLQEVELELASTTCLKLDAFLDAAAGSAIGHNDFERALQDLARFGSADHLPAKLARMLMEGGPKDVNPFRRETWTPPVVVADDIKALRADARTRTLVDRFIRDVLPFSRTDYDEATVPLLTDLCPDSGPAFSNALDRLTELGGPSHSVEAIVAGILGGDQPNFDAVIDRLAAAEVEVDTWMEREYRPEARRAEEHAVDARQADHILEEPGDRYYNVREAMKVVVRLRRARDGVQWIVSHPHRRLVAFALADLLGHMRGGVTPAELRVLLGCADGWAEGHAWWAAAQHWDPSLEDLLHAALKRKDIEDDRLRHQLIEIAAVADGSEEALDAHLQGVASATTKDRRLQLVADLMTTVLNSESRKDGQATRRARAERLARTFEGPEAEIAQALAAAMGGDELKSLGDALSGSARAEASSLLLMVAPNVLGPLACIAATAGIDPIEGVRRLLATEDASNGEAAVQALRIFGGAATKASLRGARYHSRYAVRRAALTALVAVAETSDRQALISASEDPAADVRLAWANLMATEHWPEAVGSLVILLGDRRDFSSDLGYVRGSSWAQHRVGRAAAAALGAYETLPSSAIDGLLAAATIASGDPFVPCAAVSALANKDDDRITPALIKAIASPGLTGSALHRPLAQAAAWALFDRAVAGKLVINDDGLAVAARDGALEVAGPLLMTMGIVGGDKRDALLADLRARHRNERVALLEAAAAAVNASTTLDRPMALLGRLAAGERIDQFQIEERDQLEGWARSLDVGADVNRTMAWLLSAVYHLPVPDPPQNPRAFILPERIGVLTMRSLSSAREEYQGVDDGF